MLMELQKERLLHHIPLLKINWMVNIVFYFVYKYIIMIRYHYYKTTIVSSSLLVVISINVCYEFFFKFIVICRVL